MSKIQNQSHLVEIQDDFDPDKIIQSGQTFRARRGSDGSYFFITGRSALWMRSLGGGAFEVSCSAEEWDAVWSRYFDLDRSYRSVRVQAERAGGYLAQAAHYGEGIRILRQDPWEMLLTFILSQRKNIPAIRKAVEDLSQVYGEKQEVAGQTVFFFPSPEALKPVHEETFRQMGMGYRAPYLVDAVQRVVDQRLNLKELEQVSTPDLLHALMQVHGVGTKVAHCVALYGFGRMTSAPIDVWISRAIHEQFHDVNPFPAFGESAGIMQQYVFYAMHDHMPTETGKGKVDRG